MPSLADYWGANYPYGPSGYPDGLPNMAYGPPGGGLMGYPGASPGGPSMGYPAMTGPAGAQPTPGPPPGLSLTNNPIANWLRNNVSIGAPNFANISPDAVRDARALGHGVSNLASAIANAAPTQAGAPASGPPPQPPYNPLSGGSANTGLPAQPQPDPSWPTPPVGYTSGGSPVSPSSPASPTASPASAATAAPLPPRRPKTPNLGRYPPPPNQRFIPIQWQAAAGGPSSGVLAPTPGSRAPIYTALNLFGRG